MRETDGLTELPIAESRRASVARGTRFTIWLPIASEATIPSAKVVTELPHGNGQTVKIVDDERALVALAE